MPRKAFVADLTHAVTGFTRYNISNLRAGEEDGMINFTYHLEGGGATEVTILVPGKTEVYLLCRKSTDSLK